MKRFAMSWLVWLLGSALVMGLDYFSRSRAPTFHGGGLSPALQLVLYSMVGAVAIWQMVLATRPLGAWWFRGLVTAIQIPVALFITAFANLVYGLQTGIDSL